MTDKKPKDQERPNKTQGYFFKPPEWRTDIIGFEEEEGDLELVTTSDWDLAVRYHDFKSKILNEARLKELRRISAAAILKKAHAVLGSVTHPSLHESTPQDNLPWRAQQVDFDLDETIENSVPGMMPEIWMSYSVPREQSLVLSIDTSLSMTGEKLALTAVALAVVLLQFPEDSIGIIAFENEAVILKQPDEKISVSRLVERFLDIPAQGYTHLEAGLQAADKMISRIEDQGSKCRPSTILLTDGKYTAGRDPAYLAPRFHRLEVLKMGKEKASLDLCRELAQKGNGSLREVAHLEHLPQLMYSMIKDILRGKMT